MIEKKDNTNVYHWRRILDDSSNYSKDIVNEAKRQRDVSLNQARIDYEASKGEMERFKRLYGRNNDEEAVQPLNSVVDDYRTNLSSVTNKNDKQISSISNTSVNSITESISKVLPSSIFDGFSKFMKENMSDTLKTYGSDILKSLSIGNILNDIAGNKKSSIPYEALGTHRVTVDINGIKLFHRMGAVSSYSEICDYENSMFPIRVLTCHIPIYLAQKIIKSRKKDINGVGYIFDIGLLALPVTSDIFQKQPIEGGHFVGILKNNESLYDIKDEVKIDDSTKYITDKKMKLVWYLYRQDELDFQTGDKINFMLTNPKPSEIIMKSYEAIHPKGKLLMSVLENDVNMGQYLIPHLSFNDVVKRLELEVGLYKTSYMMFYENRILMILNTDNYDNINAKIKGMSNVIELFINRRPDMNKVPYFVQQRSKDVIRYGVQVGDVEIEVKNSSAFNDGYVYITPSGKRYDHINPLGRDTHTVKKVTEVKPLRKSNNNAYEYITFKVDGGSIVGVSPLTIINTVDASGNLRTYRVCRKEIHVTDINSTVMSITGFRQIIK